MRTVLPVLLLNLTFVWFSSVAHCQVVSKDISFASPPIENNLLDIYSPKDAKELPVVFWIHGGGWQAGDKADVELKPAWFNAQGCVFVSTNYRLLPKVDMKTLIEDVARSLGWVHKNIGQYGGDSKQIFVMGHSAGAQLAAILCTDQRYVGVHGVPFSSLRGCVPVDGDTFDIPAIIEVAETRARVHQLPQATFGHRQKFGNDPAKHLDFSTVSHIASNKNIPPFLTLHVAGHPDTTAQAKRLDAVLKQHGIASTLFGGVRTDHSRLNDDIGKPNDPGTEAILKFITRK